MKNKGFTLVELVVVVAVIGILASVAIPSYQDNVKSSRRSDAQGALLGFAQAMERSFTEEGTYAKADGTDSDITALTAPTIFVTEAPIDGGSKFYDLRIVSADGSSYTLRAIPKNAQDDDGFLEISSTGEKKWDSDNSGAATGTNELCWKKSC